MSGADVSIALVGDYNPDVLAHRAIPQALALAATLANARIDSRWIGTDRISTGEAALAGCHAVWLVPGSPYRNLDGALAVAQHARESDLPFLGTCGGFQHGLLEFARNVAGVKLAGHAEIDGSGEDILLTRLSCSLVEKSGDISFAPGSQLARIFGGATATEGYHCNYGFNPHYRRRLESAGLRFTGFDKAGEVRAFELPAKRFHVGTLFQPERSSLKGNVHPLVAAFLAAAACRASVPGPR